LFDDVSATVTLMKTVIKFNFITAANHKYMVKLVL
jgi:hypothetical protein